LDGIIAKKLDERIVPANAPHDQSKAYPHGGLRVAASYAEKVAE